MLRCEVDLLKDELENKEVKVIMSLIILTPRATGLMLVYHISEIIWITEVPIFSPDL